MVYINWALISIYDHKKWPDFVSIHKRNKKVRVELSAEKNRIWTSESYHDNVLWRSTGSHDGSHDGSYAEDLHNRRWIGPIYFYLRYRAISLLLSSESVPLLCSVRIVDSVKRSWFQIFFKPDCCTQRLAEGLGGIQASIDDTNSGITGRYIWILRCLDEIEQDWFILANVYLMSLLSKPRVCYRKT